MRIEIYADVVCPWCYIGEKRLDKALGARPGVEVELRWRPFQLNPDILPGGLPWRRFAAEKFGGEEGMRAAFAHVSAAGAPDGVRFDFDRVASAPNTVDGHRLILLAQERGRMAEMAEALFEAYFAGGADLNDRGLLAELAGGIGLDPEEAAARLEGDGGTREVREAQEEALSLGIAGVPFYVFDGRYAISGAQPVETFVRALDLAREEVAG